MGVKSEAFVLNRFFQGDSAALGEKWRRESLGIPRVRKSGRWSRWGIVEISGLNFGLDRDRYETGGAKG